VRRSAGCCFALGGDPRGWLLRRGVALSARLARAVWSLRRRPAALVMQGCALCPSRIAGRGKDRHVTSSHAQARSPRHRCTSRASSPSTHRRRQRPVGGDPTVAARLSDRRQCGGPVPRWSPVHDALCSGSVPEGSSVCWVEVPALSGRPPLVGRHPGEEVRPEQATGARGQRDEGHPDPLRFIRVECRPSRRLPNTATKRAGLMAWVFPSAQSSIRVANGPRFCLARNPGVRPRARSSAVCRPREQWAAGRAARRRRSLSWRSGGLHLRFRCSSQATD
jgi:hypothetical protein